MRAGENLGRIFKVYPRAATLRPVPDLSKLDTKGLVAALDSPNGWQRDTVMRLLYEREAKDAAPALGDLVSHSNDARVRVQALATLALLGKLDSNTVAVAVKDTDAHAREYSARASESMDDSVVKNLAPLAGDKDFRVRYQLALSLGTWSKNADALDLLKRLTDQDGADAQMRPAIISSLPPDQLIPDSLQDKAATAQATAALPATTNSNPDRAKIVADYARKIMPLKGDAAKGHALFSQTCTLCHRLKEEGHEVGPDLGMVSGKPLDWLLTAILDPNAAIEARYKATLVETTTGTQMGIVSFETANSITLRAPGGVDTPLLRAKIKSLKPQDHSLMPEGLEAALTPQQLVDLVAWIRKP